MVRFFYGAGGAWKSKRKKKKKKKRKAAPQSMIQTKMHVAYIISCRYIIEIIATMHSCI